MREPVISVFSSANRSRFWLSLHENLSTSKTPFEMVFVGNEKPNFKLPSNFRYMYSNVKPAQCYYIAAYNCQGEYLINLPDDALLTNALLDDLIGLHKSENSIISPSFYCGKHQFQTYTGRKDDLPAPVGSFMHRSLWNKLGFDNNFVALYWDIDMAMQAWALGASVIISKTSCLRERKAPNLCLLRQKFGDRQFFYDLWYEIKTEASGDCGIRNRLLERKYLVAPFVWTDDILSLSQGTKNPRWD